MVELDESVLYLSPVQIIHPATGEPTALCDVTLNKEGYVYGSRKKLSIMPNVISGLKNYKKWSATDGLIHYECDEVEFTYSMVSNRQYDPLFVMVGGQLQVIPASDVEVKGVMTHFGVAPMLFNEMPKHHELFPRGFHEIPKPKHVIYYKITFPITRGLCPICGDMLEGLVSRRDIQRGKGIVCDKCAKKYKPSSYTVENKCNNCGLEFKSPVHEDYCSHNCKANLEMPYSRYKVILLDEKGVPMYVEKEIDKEFHIVTKSKIKLTAPVTRVCPHCGDIFPATRANLKRGEKVFCGKPCSNKHKFDKRVYNVCKNCGIQFQSIVDETYCCVECEKLYSEMHPRIE